MAEKIRTLAVGRLAFAKIPACILADGKLTPNAKLIFAALDTWNHCDRIYPSPSAIGKRAGLCARSVQKAIRELAANGLIDVVGSRKGGRRCTNTYVLATGEKLRQRYAVLGGETTPNRLETTLNRSQNHANRARESYNESDNEPAPALKNEPPLEPCTPQETAEQDWDSLMVYARTWGVERNRRTYVDGKGDLKTVDPEVIPELVKAAMERVTTYARICEFAAGVDPKNELRWVRREFIAEHIKLANRAAKSAKSAVNEGGQETMAPSGMAGESRGEVGPAADGSLRLAVDDQQQTAPIRETLLARIRGQDEVRVAADAEVCWHCGGGKSCNCASCGTGGLDWRPGPCGPCYGTGRLAWPATVQ